MRTAFVACLLFACLVAAQSDTTANPITRTQFQANYQETITISTGGFTTDASIGGALSGLSSSSGIVAKEASKRGLAAVGDITYSDSGMIYYDSVGRRVRNDVTSISFDFGTGPITSEISATSLILYDLGKNFTWSGSSCDCEGIDNPDIPVLYITPEVTTTSPSSASITVNGQTYTTDHYSSSVFLGGTSTTIDFYVSGQNLLRTVFSGDYLGVTVNYQFDFWNVVNLTVTDTLFTPISSCKCPAAAAPVINTTVSFPSSCGSTIFDGCSCPTSDLPAGLFCESYLTYQIAANTFVYSTDYFVQTTFQATISLMSSPSTTCQNDLKSFLCHFYFPQCGSDGVSLKPADPDFSGSDSCGSSNGNIAQQSDAYSSYATAADTQTGSSSSSSSASQVVASLLSLFFLFAALF